jgi:competence protein ComGC
MRAAAHRAPPSGRAFTLVEILIVGLIVGVLGAAAILHFKPLLESAERGETLSTHRHDSALRELAERLERLDLETGNLEGVDLEQLVEEGLDEETLGRLAEQDLDEETLELLAPLLEKARVQARRRARADRQQSAEEAHAPEPRATTEGTPSGLCRTLETWGVLGPRRTPLTEYCRPGTYTESTESEAP